MAHGYEEAAGMRKKQDQVPESAGIEKSLC